VARPVGTGRGAGDQQARAERLERGMFRVITKLVTGRRPSMQLAPSPPSRACRLQLAHTRAGGAGGERPEPMALRVTRHASRVTRHASRVTCEK